MFLNDDTKIETGDVYLFKDSWRKNRLCVIINDTGDACMVAPISSQDNGLTGPYLIGISVLGNSAFIDLRKLTIINKKGLAEKKASLTDKEVDYIIHRIKNSFRNNFNSLDLVEYANKKSNSNDTRFGQLLSKGTRAPRSYIFDIFLSHSSFDKAEIAGIVTLLEDLGYSVYVDFRGDPQLDLNRVNRETAETIRHRLKNSRTLVFVLSVNARRSAWMPWELGYFDGLNKHIVIFPIERVPVLRRRYKGQEYLKLYDYVEKGSLNTGDISLTVYSHERQKISFQEWFQLYSKQELSVL